MTTYLIAMYQPDGGPPPDMDMEPVMRELEAINDEMRAAGQWVFANGLRDSTTATVVRVRGDEVLTSRARSTSAASRSSARPTSTSRSAGPGGSRR